MKKFVICRGLPASGKSTWAEQQVLNAEPGRAVRVNMDLIREMLHAGRFGGQRTEVLTQEVRDFLVGAAMLRGASLVISDDTNLNPKTEERLRGIAKAYDYTVEVQDFTDVPVATCIKRDLQRPRSVGEKVIRDMYRRYLAPAPVPIQRDSSLPSAVLVDLDGTLAHMVDRGPYDFTRVGDDELDEVVADLVRQAKHSGHVIIVMSGRDDMCLQDSKQWLHRHGVPCDLLLMRATGDKRKDSIVKAELFDAYVAGKFDVVYVLDDRNQVVEMWRQRGLKVLQVADGDF